VLIAERIAKTGGKPVKAKKAPAKKKTEGDTDAKPTKAKAATKTKAASKPKAAAKPKTAAKTKKAAS